MSKHIAELVMDLALSLVEQTSLEIIEVRYTREAGQYYLRVFIDKPGGVTLDDCQAFSEKLDLLLDQEDPIPNPYILEVSSPGIERPLKKRSDFQRFTGRLVKVKTFLPIGGRRKFQGRLLAAFEKEARVVVDGQEVDIPYHQMTSARLVAEFQEGKR